MKKNVSIILLLALILSSTSLISQSLTLSPEKISPGDKVQIAYNPEGTPLEGLEEIFVDVYLMDEFSPQTVEVPVKYADGKFTGLFDVPQNIKAVLFSFTDETMNKRDNNDKKGYKTICYKADKKTPVAGAYTTKAIIVSQYAWLTDLDRNMKKAVKLMNKEFEHYPDSKNNYEYQKFFAIAGAGAKNEDVINGAKEKASAIMEQKKPSEEALGYALAIHQSVTKDKEMTASVKEKYAELYPKSTFAANELRYKIRRSRNLDDVMPMYEKFVKDFAHIEEFNKNQAEICAQIANLYIQKEDFENFEKYFAKVSDNSRKAGILNSVAWPMSGESLEGEAKNPVKAQKLSMQSLELLDGEMKKMKNKPDYLTNRQYKRNLENSYGMYADTYALLAYKNNQMDEALKYQQISCDNNKFSDAEMNERYCAYYEAVHGAKATENILADLIADGKASAKMQEQHKRLYLANNTLKSAYEKYALQLEKAAHAKLKAEIEEQMIEMPAPDFKLMTLNGEQVSLEEMRGKVVVVDFWATWCGPCKASFPGMQNAVNKFENSNDVEFVFIDTWESGKNVKEKVAEFISENKYTFNVLMDSESKTVAEYGVSGIPTKFIIDKDGNIRFKSVGYSGNNEKLVNELSLMIEILGGTVPTPETGAP